MEIGAITGYVDAAQVVLYVFWVFFFGLVFYLQVESKREGYPLETDSLDPAKRKTLGGLIFMPKPKTFRMADGRTVQAPDPARADRRPLKAKALGNVDGYAITPDGDAMLAEVGPGSYAMRADVPDQTIDQTPKIVPMRVATDFHVEERDPDPRGMVVIGADGKQAGTITDIWVDRSEFVIRFLEMSVAGETPKKALLPITLVRVNGRRREVHVASLLASQFAHIPGLANPDQVTLLEEEKIYGYFGAGTLYQTPRTAEPLL